MKNKKKLYSIELFFKLSGQYDTYKLLLKNYFQLLRKKYKNIDEQEFIKIENEFSINLLLKKFIGIYDKNFNEQEIQLILDFYNSEIWKKMKKHDLNKSISNIFEQLMVNINKNFSNMEEK